jgi:hypothetical protein
VHEYASYSNVTPTAFPGRKSSKISQRGVTRRTPNATSARDSQMTFGQVAEPRWFGNWY